MTICCLNPDCSNPLNPDGNKFCLTCSTPLVILLRNRFQVMRVLSDEGGFGRTYLAEDVDKLNELCVIKQLAPKAEGSWALKKAIELFQKEAQRLQQLGENPQIPTLIAYFEQDSYLYLVQQYINGQNLLRELNLRRQGKALQSPYSEAEIRKILLDLLPILKFIHENGVIHRDIKPQNIVRRQSDGRLNLIDFGSSKQLTARVQSKIGTSIGSHGYSPIEQIRDGAAYPACDLFSLGATAFHLLTGVSPFKLWTEHGYAWVGGWRKFLKVQVSDEFAAVLDKLLKKDKNQRYQSADEVIQDLSRGLHPSERLFPVGTSQQQTFLSSNPKGNIKLQFIIVGVAGVLLLVVGNFWYKQFYFDGRIPANLSQPNRTSTDGHLDPGYNRRHSTENDATLDSQKSFMPNFTLAVTIRGYASSVLSIAISPDGNTVASTNNDTIQLWSLTTGQAISTLFGHENRVNAIAINPNGKILASGSDDNRVKLWNLDNGQEIRTLSGHRGAIRTLAMSPEGQILASGSDDKTIKLWNLATREEIRTIRGHTAAVRTVAFSPDGRILAAGSLGTIKLWNLDGREVATFGELGEVTTIAFSPDGKYLACGSNNSIKIWNLKTGEQIHRLEGHTGEITKVAFSPDGMILASASSDRTIKLWDYTTAKNIRTLAKHGDSVETFAFSLDGKTIVSGGADRTLRVWRQP